VGGAAVDPDGPPAGAYYEAAEPNGKLYFNNIPASAATNIRLLLRMYFGRVALTDVLVLPPGYESALTLTLMESDRGTAARDGLAVADEASGEGARADLRGQPARADALDARPRLAGLERRSSGITGQEPSDERHPDTRSAAARTERSRADAGRGAAAHVRVRHAVDAAGDVQRCRTDGGHNANPIVASAGGLVRADLPLAGVAYKYVLTDSLGNPLWSQDPVTATGFSVAALTNHGVVLGTGTEALASTSAGTAGQVLTSNGASADPTFQYSGSNGVQDFRLTLESGVPVSSTDQTAKTTLYATPYLGNRIALFERRWRA
jgi:hypothetical protein